jgi:hypothetical protein
LTQLSQPKETRNELGLSAGAKDSKQNRRTPGAAP